MIIELTHYFNWQGSLLNPGQVLSDLPDGLANNLVKAGNAKLWTPAKVTPDAETIQADESADIPERKVIPAGRIPADTDTDGIPAPSKVESFGRNRGVIKSDNNDIPGKPVTTGRPARSGKTSGTAKAKTTAKK
ncbi:MAG: hypothetical protein WC748_10005 [Legionellales bacterium]|jgi:hypothetical protein